MTPTPDDEPVPAGLALAPTPRLSLTEAVASQLADVILRSELGPGDRLPSERDLARRLKVSRIVVREAVGRLVERGLVKGRPGVGTFVVRMEDEAVTGPLSLYIRQHGVRRDHLFDLRSALEPAIAASAARGADERDLGLMADNLTRTEAIAQDVESSEGEARTAAIEAFAWADLEFHQRLARSTGNPLYEILLNPLIDRLVAVRREGAELEGTARCAAAGHRAVLDHVSARDADGAERSMAEHLAEVASWLTRADPPESPHAAADPRRPSGSEQEEAS